MMKIIKLKKLFLSFATASVLISTNSNAESSQINSIVAIAIAEIAELKKEIESLKSEITVLKRDKSTLEASLNSTKSTLETVTGKQNLKFSNLPTLTTDVSKVSSEINAVSRKLGSYTDAGHFNGLFRIYPEGKYPNGNLMWAFETDGNLILWRCSNLRTFQNCHTLKVL